MTVVIESRRARSRKLCRLLTNRIGEVTSPGLGNWDPGWECVAEPSDRMLDALAAWERTGKEEHMDAAKAATLELLEAWKEAERRYQAAGRPREEVSA